MTTFEKAPWRKRTLEALLKAKHKVPALWDGSKLRYPFLDLLGGLEDTPSPKPPEMFSALELYLKDRERSFIAVERDVDRAYDYKLAYQQSRLTGSSEFPFQVHVGDVYRIANRVSTTNPAGVYCYDAFGMAGQQDWWENTGSLIRSTVNETCKRIGFCAVILNKVLDPDSRLAERELPSAIVLRHTQYLVDLFGTSRGITKQWVYGDEPGAQARILKQVDDLEFGRKEGQRAGNYEVYLSRGKRQRMLTLRMMFTGDRKAFPLVP